MTPRAVRFLTCVLAGVLGWAVLVGVPGDRVLAVTGSDWAAGQIISDQQFYDRASMTEPQVRQFLQTKGANCVAGERPCLKDYTTATPVTPREAGLCEAMPADDSATASEIFTRVAMACSISPKVLMVMVQKEQGLITGTRPTAYQYDRAAGFACPDTPAGCNALYFGFFNQVYRMARQFQIYTDNPTRFGYQAGRTNTILYNPTASCGSAPVYLQNQATANLYIYTPYQPNAAALANLYGTGDSCSAYGNRNFWRYFNDWFGPSYSRPPVGNVDSVDASGTAVVIRGWTYDPDAAARSIHLATFTSSGALVGWTLANEPRPDVNAAFGITGDHGFTISIPSQPPGPARFCVYMSDYPTEAHVPVGCVDVVVNAMPRGNFEAVSYDFDSKSVVLSGWMYDPDHPATSIYGASFVDTSGLVGWGLAADPRPDVNAGLGLTGNHGFSYRLPAQPDGVRTYCVSAANVGSPDLASLGCRRVLVANQQSLPVGNFEAAAAAGTGSVRLVGWTLDPNSSARSINIAIWRSDVGLVYWGPASEVRSDVNSYYATTGGHGFDVTLSGQPRGTVGYCVSAADQQLAGQLATLGCRSVSVV